MKYKLLRYSLLSMLVMLCGGGIFAIGHALSKANDDVKYVKVTSASDLTDGEYLIVYEGDDTHDAVAFNGALETLDAIENGVAVTIENNTIASSADIDAAVFTIDMTDGFLKSASGYYIGVTSNSNGLKQSENSEIYENSFDIDADGNAVITAVFSGSTMSLRYNYASNQLRFRYFKNAGQQPIALYKKTTGDEEPPVQSYDYYVVGSMTNWAPNSSYKMTRNVYADGEEYMLTKTFAAGDQLKVAKSDGQTIVETDWYPDGMDNNYVVSEAGEYTVYFRPGKDGNADWYEGYFYLESTQTKVANVAALNELAGDTKFKFTGEALVVAKPTPKYVYIKDDTGSSLIYDNSGELTANIEAGKHLAANWTGKVSIYKKLFEVVPDAALAVTDADIEELDIPTQDFSYVTAEHVNEVIILSVDSWEVSGNNLTLKLGNETLAGYNQFGIELPTPEDGKGYIMMGAIGRYNDNIQFQPMLVEEFQVPVEEPVTVEKLWIVGDANGWGETAPNLKEMTYNEDTQAFEYEVEVNTADLYFAFCDVASVDSWDAFANGHRIAVRNDEGVLVVEGQPIQLRYATGNACVYISSENPGKYTLSVTKDLMLSIKKTGEVPAVTVDKLYVIGNMNNWDRTAMIELGTNDQGNFVYTIDSEESMYFAFADYQQTAAEAEADPNWADFNANHRWAIAAGNQIPTLDTEYQLQHADGAVELAPGQYTVIVTPDLKMTVSGEPGEFEYSSVYVAGNGSTMNWLNGSDWDAGAEANKLAEVADDVWEITFNDVAAGEGYEFKFTIDGAWNVNFGIEDQEGFEFGTEYPGIVEGANIKFSLTEASDVTMHLDMTEYDNTTKQGAKFTVTATPAGEEPVEEEGLWIKWGEDDIASTGNVQPSYGEDDFYLTTVDNNDKMAIDANNAYFGTAEKQYKFTHRLKSGGKSSSNNNMTLTIAKAGTLNVFVRTGSNSAIDRNLVLTQDDNELYNAVILESDAIEVMPENLNVSSAPALAEGDPVKVYPIISIPVVAGTVLIEYPTNSLNFYAFQLIPEEEGTGIRNLEVTQGFDESLPAYNLQGQRVTKSYRGVIIQNGRKFYNK